MVVAEEEEQEQKREQEQRARQGHVASGDQDFRQRLLFAAPRFGMVRDALYRASPGGDGCRLV